MMVPRTVACFLVLGVAPLLGGSPLFAQSTTGSAIVVLGPVEPILIPNVNPRRITNPAALLRPRRILPPRQDPLLERQLSAAPQADLAFTTPSINVAGMDPSCCPPDTVGEVGTTHFIQMINGVGGAGTNFQIFDKATGAAVSVPQVLEGLAPAGDPCAGGDGDPIPLFDQLAERWVLTQFETATNALCLYVSSGADPTTSSWMLYRFNPPEFPDYPKFAVWPSAYFAAVNDGGRRVFALDRAAMLAGSAATGLFSTVSVLPGFAFQIVPPVDLAGPNAPPAGAPGIFIRHRDDEAHDLANTPTVDTLEIFEFTPDFATPANSTFTGPTSISVTDFDSDLCGLTSFNCVPQPGTTQQLDPLREPVMQRPVYWNFGTHQSLIGSFATDVDGFDRAGIRWFELRRAAGTATGGWSLYQEGTVSAADTLSRWMSSLAMDQSGNMALGYSSSGPNTGQFPSIRYTGRLATDVLGTMPQVESEIIAGGDSQDFSERWGDYSGMTVDPVDDCTFWFTTEYTPPGNMGFPLTRIASFRFDSCSVSCSAGADFVTVTHLTDSGSANYSACVSIDFGPGYEITASGVVTATAPLIRLLNDVSISGTFTADSSVP